MPNAPISLQITAGAKTFSVNGQKRPLDIPLRVEACDSGDEHAVAPLRPILEALGHQVDWLEPAKALRVVDSVAPLSLVWPVDVREITTKFAEVDKSLWLDFHQGIDIAAPEGSRLWAPCDATLIASCEEPPATLVGYGRYIILQTWPYYLLFAHLSQSQVSGKAAGIPVRQYDLLGLTGSTGLSTGPHLHFGVYDARMGPLVDPESGRFNGMAAVDPMKFLGA